MIIIAGYVRYNPGKAKTLKAAMDTVLAASRAEPGNIEYNFAFDVQDEDRVFIQEKWKSWDDLEKHMQQPHIAPWRAAVAEAGVVERNLRAWEVEGEGKQI